MKNNQLQKNRPVTANSIPWVKPSFQVIRVSFECTAYAGSL
jgi:coenzyme PQQ precursor peptide PqqA